MNDDIHKTSANDPSAAVPEPETSEKPVVVALDRSATSFGTIFRIVAVTLVLLFVGGFLASIISSLTYLFFLLVLSIFFAYLIDPLVKLIRRPFKARQIEKFMPRSLAIVIAYILVFTGLGVSIASVAPIVAEQAKEFAGNVPSYATSVRERANELNRRFDRLRLPDQLSSKLNEKAAEIVDTVTTFITAVVLGGFVFNLITYSPWLFLVPILAFFFLKDVNLIRLAVLRVFPAGPYRMRAELVMQDVNTTLAAYTRAQLISCVIIGTICTIGFYVLGLKYALLLGILAGVFEFVPLLGPAAIGLIVITTSALGDNPWRALYVFIFLVVLRIVHDYVTYPRIVRGGLHLHPVLIIISVLAGEQVAGIPGVFLAIPIVAIITVFYRHVVEHKGGKGLVAGMLERSAPAEEARS